MSDSLLGAIVPKSDQLNSDDLIGGPRTVTITNVTVSAGEQPVAIHFNGDNGKPWKPSKSMCRVLVQLWGPDGKQYAGKSLTLFRDPTIKFGGMAVGGIRISEMSGIGTAAVTLALTASKGKRAPFVVKPLATAAAKAPAKTPRDAAGPMVDKFAGAGVSREMLERHLGCRVEDMTSEQLSELRGVFKKLGDGSPATELLRNQDAPASKPAPADGDDVKLFEKFASEIESAKSKKALQDVGARMLASQDQLGGLFKECEQLYRDKFGSF